MNDVLGSTSSPALIATNGMSSSSYVVFVSSPGVGAGTSSDSVIAISGRLNASFLSISSTSSAGVYGVISGDPPAPLIPFIFDTSVFPSTHANTMFSDFSRSFRTLSEPNIFTFSTILNSSIIFINKYNINYLIQIYK